MTPDYLPASLPCPSPRCYGTMTLWHYAPPNTLTTYRCPDCGEKERIFGSDYNPENDD